MAGSNNNNYKVEGNDTRGYYWVPTDLASCADAMKNVYNGIKNGTIVPSDEAWSVYM